MHLRSHLGLCFERFPELEWLLLVNFFGDAGSWSPVILLLKASELWMMSSVSVQEEVFSALAGMWLKRWSQLVTNSGPSKPPQFRCAAPARPLWHFPVLANTWSHPMDHHLSRWGQLLIESNHTHGYCLLSQTQLPAFSLLHLLCPFLLRHQLCAKEMSLFL